MYITVLNYETGEVIIKEVPKELEEIEDGDDIFANMGFNYNNSDYMIVSDDLHIKVETKGLTVDTTLIQNL